MVLNKVIYFTDIDDTVIYTERKLDNRLEWFEYAYKKDGSIGSYISLGMKKFIDTLYQSPDIIVVPTSARNLDSFNRTKFKKDYAILNFGGLVIRNSIVDQEYNDIIVELYNGLELSIDKLFNRFKLCDLKRFNVKIIDGYYISLLCRDSGLKINVREVLNQFCLEYPEYIIYENGDSFALLPKFLNKKLAVDYIIDKQKPSLTIGVGDNRSDLAFMKSCDMIMSPTKSNLL